MPSNNFPINASEGQLLTAGTTAVRASLGDRYATFSPDVMLHNRGLVDVYAAAGGATVTATPLGYPVPAGAIMVYAKGGGVTHISLITLIGTADVVVYVGEGS